MIANSDNEDSVWMYCPACDEDYEVPESQIDCPLCGGELFAEELE